MAPAWPEPLTTPVSEGAALLWMASSWTNFIKHIGSPQCAIERSNGSVKWRGFQHEPQLLVCCCAVVRLISLPSSLMHTRGLQFPNPVCWALTSLRRSGIEVWGQLWWARCCLTHKARHNRPFLQEKKSAKINLHRCPQLQTCHWILPFLCFKTSLYICSEDLSRIPPCVPRTASTCCSLCVPMESRCLLVTFATSLVFGREKKRNRFSHPCRGSWGLGHNCWRVTWACREYVHGKLSRANFPFLFCPCACAIQLLIQFHKMGTDRKVEKNKPDMGMCCENNYRKLSS